MPDSLHQAPDPSSQPLAELVRLGIHADESDHVVALAGNPNTGKSTVFNALTGLRQHTGNWPGKTVTRAEGGFSFNDKSFKIVDLPGTYSLLATSPDEEVARDFVLFGRPDVTIVVVDATRLERNLNLVLQVLQITDRVVVCLNLMDEARRHGHTVDHEELARQLGVPVVATSARYGKGMDDLLTAVHRVASGKQTCRPHRVADYGTKLQGAVGQMVQALKQEFPSLPNGQWVALRMLDADQHVVQAVRSGEIGRLLDDTKGNDEGQAAVHAVSPQRERIHELASRLRWDIGPEFHQAIVESIYAEAARIADAVVTRPESTSAADFDRKLDGLLTSRRFGYPVMVLLLAGVLWLTVSGANVPSKMLAWLLMDTLHPILKSGAVWLSLPWWLDGLLIDGVYLATAWVISVMLPPMAIFFPLFTLLEDFGYLPRAAFNLDSLFRRCGAHGKQCLTMCMGFGCNAAGVISTRIIDSPRERLIAIITNNFSLCNGRWPTQILIATIFLGALVPAALGGLISTLAVVAVALLGVALMFAVSWGLSRTVLQGEPSAFSLELPPYRPPRILQTLYTSLIDRTMFVLWRAIVFAVPAGAVIWLMCNISVGSASLAEYAVGGLDSPARWFGLTGVILLAYLVAIPANEIVVPTIVMLIVLNPANADLLHYGEGTGVMFEPDEAVTLRILQADGWTVLTAVCLMLFSLVHNPCTTTIYTIWKETRSVKWTAVASLLPVVLGFILCFLVAQTWTILSGV